jgi:hypothetical protein
MSDGRILECIFTARLCKESKLLLSMNSLESQGITNLGGPGDWSMRGVNMSAAEENITEALQFV